MIPIFHSYSDALHSSTYSPILKPRVDFTNPPFITAPAGLSTHYDLPKTKLDPQMKRDLQLLSMRAVLDPKRMYKKQGKFKIPDYSQVGTIIEGPTEFFSSRLTKAERNGTFVGEALKSESESGRFKRKYEELQKKKQSGKKGFYRSLMTKRRKFV
jgi:hypothetical protein